MRGLNLLLNSALSTMNAALNDGGTSFCFMFRHEPISNEEKIDAGGGERDGGLHFLQNRFNGNSEQNRL